MKAFFLSRQLREKALLVLFLVAAALIWLSSLTTRAGLFSRKVKDTSDDLTLQRLVLNRKQAVDTRAKVSIEQLDPSRTLDSLGLHAELDTLARQNGINNSTSSDLESTRAGQFAIHTVQLVIRNVDYRRLVDFYASLSKRAPYVGVELVSLRANAGQLQASLKVSSVQILPDSAR